MANGDSSLQATGLVHLQLRIGGKSFACSFYVAPALNLNIIIGIKTLDEEQAILDLTRHVLYFGRSQRVTAPLVQSHRPCIQAAAIDLHQLRHSFPADLQQKFFDLIQAHREIFGPLEGRLRQTRTVQHEIKTVPHKPFRIAPYPCSEKKRAIIEEQVQEMLAEGIIEPSCSPYSSPVVLQPKKDGKMRFCVDYSRINQFTVDTSQCIPTIHIAVKDIGNAKVFSSLDLKSGYWQVAMDPDSIKYTAFATHSGGCYQFRVMPFGLKGAPGTFQLLMSQEVLSGYFGIFCLVYLDDVIVYSQTPEEHLRHLALIFERLQLHGLTVAMDKSKFGVTELIYLGHKTTPSGNQPLPEHISKIQALEAPKTRRQLQALLGTCGWLREYIPRYSEITAPLTDLVGKSKAFK